MWVIFGDIMIIVYYINQLLLKLDIFENESVFNNLNGFRKQNMYFDCRNYI